MGNKNKKKSLFIKVSGDSRTANFETSNLFRHESVSQKSPIDIYLEKNKSFLVKLGNLERGKHISPEKDGELYNLFLLGMVSNVESFFRHLFRKLILIDPSSYEQCLEQNLTYAAALHHEQGLLPEALLEQCTFTSLENIKTSAKSFLDISINKGSVEQKELVGGLADFEQLCHLRHCIVHRGGLLGSKNAVKLGISKHKNFFEKPIFLDLDFLQEANAICLNSVKNFNNFTFNQVIQRYVEINKQHITWNYVRDKKWFKPYFELFDSSLLNQELVNRGGIHYTSKSAYDELRSHHN